VYPHFRVSVSFAYSTNKISMPADESTV